MLIGLFVFGCSTGNVLAQAGYISQSTLYIPLIGITSVPDPLALPKEGGYVTYNYAVKNFISGIPLSNIQVVDDKCTPVKFIGGDDNHDSRLDYNETWRYTCTTYISQTTQSITTATGIANGITATHKAYTTVVAGSPVPPLVSIVNVTKIAYPLSLPAKGGNITYTYKVTNPGIVPLSDVTVSDNKCAAMSSRLGDTNADNLLENNEVWIYNCTANLKQTTTNTVTVTAFANGLKAVGSDTITVKVNNMFAGISPKFPAVGGKPEVLINPYTKIIIWIILSGILLILIIRFSAVRKKKDKKIKKSKTKY